MKLYLDSSSPNARRVQIFAAVKKIELSEVEIDVRAGENRSAQFIAKNPLAQVPVLELDDGVCISESLSICRYLEESFPEPRLFGSTARHRAIVDMWCRRMEFRLYNAAVEYGHHVHPAFRDRVNQIPDFAAFNRDLLDQSYSLLDSELASRDYIAGDSISIADLTAYCGIELARLWRVAIPEEYESLRQWHEGISARPWSGIARYV